MNEVKSANVRRADNIQMAVNKDLTCLEMHVRVALRVRRALARFQWAARALFVGGVLLLTTAGFLVANLCGTSLKDVNGFSDGNHHFLKSLCVLALSGLAGFVFFRIMRHAVNRFLEQQVDDLDETFALEYNRELSLGTRDDLRQYWTLTQPVLAGLLRGAWRTLPVFPWGALRRLQRDVARTSRT